MTICLSAALKNEWRCGAEQQVKGFRQQVVEIDRRCGRQVQARVSGADWKADAVDGA